VRVAWFSGNVQEPEWQDGPRPPWRSQAELLALPAEHEHAPKLRVLLVPDDADTSQLWGDDWNDAPASCNAGDPYDDTFPPGAVMLTLHVGDRVELSVPV